MKKLIVSVVLIVILGGLVWYYFNSKNEGKSVVESDEVTYRFKAIDLFNKYAENQELADRQFLNKVIQIEGKVAEMDHDQMGNRILVLKDEGDIFGVVCTLDEANNENRKLGGSIKTGDYLILKGICTGFDVEVKMNQCVIIANKNAEERI